MPQRVFCAWPEIYQVHCLVSGRGRIAQDGRDTALHPGQFVIAHSSRPAPRSRGSEGASHISGRDPPASPPTALGHAPSSMADRWAAPVRHVATSRRRPQ
ncbi:hypothetical protein ACFRCX_24590 [Streptomyces sp. NPDC056652]|uniref:AraC-like ligand-binding domain-containing protein n=1 Tax=Streptomyces sp. NPDC056652 TaxID=3345893 RepID=UPI003687D48B